jgi:hypothetical protein
MNRLPRGGIRRGQGGVSPDATPFVPPEPVGLRQGAGVPPVLAQIPAVFLVGPGSAGFLENQGHI